MITKKFWQSKTFWINLIACWAMISQAVIGEELFAVEAQAAILAAINLVLRSITNTSITLK